MVTMVTAAVCMYVYLESFEELFSDGDGVCWRDEVTSSDSLPSVLHHRLNHLRERTHHRTDEVFAGLTKTVQSEQSTVDDIITLRCRSDTPLLLSSSISDGRMLLLWRSYLRA